jgi:hypothetical protein
MIRHDDVDGWEIPARYLGFLRGGPAHPLLAVVRHNDEDVRSLARLIALLDDGYATAASRRTAPIGDLAGLARAFVRARRHEEALGCLDEVLTRSSSPTAGSVSLARPAPTRPAPTTLPAHPAAMTVAVVAGADEPWWSPRVRPDFGGRPRIDRSAPGWPGRAAFSEGWDTDRIAVDRAHLLRRLGRFDASLAAWSALAAGPGRTAVVARIEMAKLQEHRLGDPRGALTTALDGLTAAERRRRLGRPEPALEADLRRRIARLRRRRAIASADRRLDGHLGELRGHDQATDALTQRTGTDGEVVGDALEADALDGQGARRGREPEVGTDASPEEAHHRRPHGRGEERGKERVPGPGRVDLAVGPGRQVAQ